MDAFELFESFKRGETVLFLYSPFPPYVLLKRAVEYCKKKGLELYHPLMKKFS